MPLTVIHVHGRIQPSAPIGSQVVTFGSSSYLSYEFSFT